MVTAFQSLVGKPALSPRRWLLPIVALVAALLVILQLAGENVDQVNAGLVYVLLTLLAAVSFGVRAGLGAASLSCILVNYFFLEPIFGFAMSEPQHILSLPVFFVVALVGSSLHQAPSDNHDTSPITASAPKVGRQRVDLSQHAGLTVDSEAQQVFVDGRLVRLTPTEMRLLRFLAARPGRVQTAQAILCGVWGEGYAQDARILRTYMNQLRSKLGDDANSPRFISTEPGFGYRFLD